VRSSAREDLPDAQPSPGQHSGTPASEHSQADERGAYLMPPTPGPVIASPDGTPYPDHTRLLGLSTLAWLLRFSIGVVRRMLSNLAAAGSDLIAQTTENRLRDASGCSHPAHPRALVENVVAGER